MIEGVRKMPRKSQQVAVEVAENTPKNKVGKETPSGKQTEVTNVDTPRKADMEPENHIHLPSTSI